MRGRIQAATDRIVVATLVSAMVIGLAVLLTASPPGWESWSGLTYGFGTLVLFVSGGYMALRLVRGRRAD